MFYNIKFSISSLSEIFYMITIVGNELMVDFLWPYLQKLRIRGWYRYKFSVFTKKVQFYSKLHFGNNGCWVKHKSWFYTVLAWRQSTAHALLRCDSCRSCVQSFDKLFLSPGDDGWKCAFQRVGIAQMWNRTEKSFSSRSSYARIFHYWRWKVL